VSFEGKSTSREIDLDALDPKNITFEIVDERRVGSTVYEGGTNVLYKGCCNSW
jgi:hypothetical protein